MGVDVTTLAGGALGGAFAQSILGPLFGQRHERRDLRAKVLAQIAELENARWAPGGKDDFIRLTHELRASALVAGLHRDPIEFYVTVAAAARQQSEETLIREEDDVGFIPSSLNALTRHAAATISDYAWHPHLQRLLLPLKMRRLFKEKTSVGAGLDRPGERIQWDRGLIRLVGARTGIDDGGSG